MTWTLVTIPISHYCDKARWALDRAGIAYTEDGHVPMLHYMAARRAKGKRTVPILLHDHGVAADSTDILHLIDARLPSERKLFPDEPLLRTQVVEWEELFDRSLGPASRRWAYFHLLSDPKLATEILDVGTPRHEATIVRLAFPVFAGFLRRGLNITPQKAAQSLEKVQSLFAAVSAHLADGRRYICGDRFTAADLTFAALASPVLLPEGHPKVKADYKRVPAAMRAEIEALRATPAGQLALRLYREER